jgi:hypothetical protein
VAKKKTKQDEANERAVEVEQLPKELRSTARELGFRQRVSLNKIARGVEHEKWAEKLCKLFALVTGLVGAGFLVARYFAPLEKRGEFFMISLFALAWAGLSWVFGYRATRRQKGLAQLDAVVKDRLGK